MLPAETEEKMEKNDLVMVSITDLTTDGEGIGKADAFPLFIKDAVVGDVIRARVLKMKKTYGYARIEELITPSPDRVGLTCPKARACGGCQIQQMSYEAQLQYKTRKVIQNLRRIGGFDAVSEEGAEKIFVRKTLGMSDPWRYRNKAQIPVGKGRDGRVTAGFYAVHSHEIIPMAECALAFPEASEVQRLVLSWMEKHRISAYDETRHQGTVRHLLIRKGFSTGEIMLCLIVFPQEMKKLRGALPELMAELKGIKGYRTLCLNTNEEFGNVILGNQTETLDGPGFIEDLIGDVRFRISPQSFFQVNPAQTNVLYGKALEFAGLTGNETVWDLYCGIGTISLFLAQKARKVYGVEIVPQAIEDAKKNAELNGIGNAEFFTGAAEEVLPAWYQKHPDETIDVICVDPPRKGCDEKCLETIGKMAPARVVYVSCDSATLARDLKVLTEKYGYRIEDVQPVDMFPQTVHVETVVRMSRIERKTLG